MTGAQPTMSQADARSGSPDHNMTGIFLLLVGVLAFTIQDVIVKFVSGGYSIHQIVLLRCLGALPLILAVLVYEDGVKAFLRAPHALISIRSIIQYISYTLWFLAIATISIADALAIGFISPLIITALAGLVLREHVGLDRWLAILAGFAGTILMLRPGFGVFEPAALLVFLSATCYAAGAILTRRIGVVASSATMGLNSLMLGILMSGLAGLVSSGGYEVGAHPSLQLMFRAWQWPTLPDLLLMLSAGVAAGIGMITVAQAYRISQPAVIAPFEYSGMFWALIAGYAFWSQSPDMISIAGITIVIGAGLYIASLEGRRRTAGHGLQGFPSPRIASATAPAISRLANRNGAPGICSPPVPLIAQEKNKGNNPGPMRLATPVSDEVAPWSLPCSVAPTWRVISACKAGFEIPQKAMMGTPNNAQAPVGASP